jgi:probable HAF family extracellular repeat protein
MLGLLNHGGLGRFGCRLTIERLEDRTAPASFQGLGDLPFGLFRSEAYALSADGSVVVGASNTSFTPIPRDDPFRWTQSTGILSLGPSFSPLSAAYGVSADGSVIVGGPVFLPQFGVVAFRWTESTGYVPLVGVRQAYGISADGSSVVGERGRPDIGPGSGEAILWTQAAGVVGLGDFSGGNFRSSAASISADATVVVGHSAGALGDEAFRWSELTGMIGLGDLPGGSFHSSASAVSSNGLVVVGMSVSAFGQEAFRWTQTGGMVGMGDLPGGVVGSSANAVSSDGSIVVGSSHTGAIDQEAFLWDEAHGMRNLRTVLVTEQGLGSALVGWHLTSATAITPDGRTIVGFGYSPRGAEAWIARLDSPKVVNIITHGFKPNPFQSWEDFRRPFTEMGQLLDSVPLANTELHGQVRSYVSQWDSSTGWLQAISSYLNSVVFVASGQPVAASLALLQASFHMETARKLAEGAAHKIVNDVISMNLLGDPQLSQNNQQFIHLVGHSRGGAVNARVAELLSKKGYKIEQYTALDGYSVDWPHGSSILADIDITSTVNKSNIHRKYNYRVQDGLAAYVFDIVEPFLGAPFSPIIRALIEGNVPDWRAPIRPGLTNVVITGDSTDPRSNHINIVGIYNRSGERGSQTGPPGPEQYILQNYIGWHRNDPPSANANAAAQFTTGAAGPDGSVGFGDFTDGSIERLGELQRHIAATIFPDIDDDAIRAWIAQLRDPLQILSSVWDVSGIARIAELTGNSFLELVQTANTSVGQLLVLDEATTSLQFDLSVLSAGPDDTLEVFFDNQLIGSWTLTDLPATGRYSISLLPFRSRVGNISFRINGPESSPATIGLDNLKISSELIITEPAVDSVIIGDGSTQRSLISGISIAFNSAVTIEDGAFELAKTGGGLVNLKVLTSTIGGRTTVLLTFDGEPDGSLADGSYTLTIRADRILDSAGRSLESDRVESFSRLFGDSNGDSHVDDTDLALFREALNTTFADAEFFSSFDSDGDGDVDYLDYFRFRQRFGERV